MIFEIIACMAVTALPVAFWAGHEWGKRRYRAPISREGHTNEYLYKNDKGVFVPYQPPQYAPEGMSPVAAEWAKFHETGIPHQTRRVEN